MKQFDENHITEIKPIRFPHEEETVGDQTDFPQIWFDPNIRKTIQSKPTYNEHKNEDFSIDLDRQFQYPLCQEKILALVVISGKGLLFDMQTGSKHPVNKKYFALIHAYK